MLILPRRRSAASPIDRAASREALVAALAVLAARCRPGRRRGRTAASRRAALVRGELRAAATACYAANCRAATHGAAHGSTEPGPPLRGVGALAADFYLRTGYMPLATPDDQPTPRARASSPSAEIRALVAYVASLGHGPPVPTPHPERGQPVARACSCSPSTAPAATRSSRRAATSPARGVPPLDRATPTQIAEAVRIGPYLMPRFSTKRDLATAQLDSIVAYVAVRASIPEDRGGWAIGHLGPFPEGLVAWLLAAPRSSPSAS